MDKAALKNLRGVLIIVGVTIATVMAIYKVKPIKKAVTGQE